MAIFIVVCVLTLKYEDPLKTSDDVEKHHVSISRAGSLVTAEGTPRGYLASHVVIRTVSPPNVSVHIAYCKVLAACQRGQSLGERDAVKIQVLFAHNIKSFGQQRQSW